MQNIKALQMSPCRNAGFSNIFSSFDFSFDPFRKTGLSEFQEVPINGGLRLIRAEGDLRWPLGNGCPHT